MMFIIDTVNEGGAHLFYNDTFIRKIMSEYPGEIRAVLNCRELYRATVIQRSQFNGFFNLFYLVIRSRPKKIIFLAVNIKSLLFGALLSVFGLKVFAHTHSFLQNLLQGRYKHRAAILLYLTAGGAFLVNSSGIARRARTIVPYFSSRFINIGHPLRVVDRVMFKKAEKIHIGFLGSAHENKGIEKFLRLKSLYGQKYIFSVNGTNLGYASTASFYGLNLTEKDYIKFLTSVDILFCFYPPNNYNLYPSGTVLDGLAAAQPMLCSDTAFVRDVFSEHADKFIFPEAELDRIFEDPALLLATIEGQRAVLSEVLREKRQELEFIDFGKLLCG
jgi:hypothetical protein